jgi:hypothetical protein
MKNLRENNDIETTFNDITVESAELAGIFAADGSMQKQHISFWGNITEDKDHYNQTIKRLFRAAFQIDINPHEKASNSVYGFYVCDKKVIKYFNEFLGFKFGNKTYTVQIPNVIMKSENPEIWSAFIRGFCDSDGSLNFDKRRGKCRDLLKIIHTYPRIQIKSASPHICSDISILLNRLSINHIVCRINSRKPNEKDQTLVQISGKKRLEDWINKVGFNNPVNQTRYEIFKKHGFVPPRTTIAQRKDIIAGFIDPWKFYPMAL